MAHILQISAYKRRWTTILSFAFGIVLLGGLFYHLHSIQPLSQWKSDFLQLKPQIHWASIILALVLVAPNWLLEALKWRAGMSTTSDLSVKSACTIVLRGVMVASITPARAGEYLGRIIGLPSARLRIKSLTVTMMNSIAQNAVTIYFGFLGAVFLFRMQWVDIPWPTYALGVMTVSSLLLLGIGYFSIDRLISKYGHLLRYKNWGRTIRAVTPLSLSSKYRILGLSALRYGVYVIQYICIAYAFQIHAPIIQVLSVVTVILCLQSLIPLPATIAIVARAEIALVLWSVIGAEELAILFTTYTLWFINIVLPAILGYMTIWTQNVIRV